jgi:glucosamine kinase
MILIADSGSTKTEWRVIDGDGKISQIKTDGVNPYYMTEAAISDVFSLGLKKYIDLPIEKIYFYGAGCTSDSNKQKITRCLKESFPMANIEVSIDLLAAARALCGYDSGIACILGTGCNSCLYDGSKIIENVPSLGYIMGDEGSGSYLGKMLLGDFLRKDLPSGIAERLEKRYDFSNEAILKNVYQEDLPIKYMSSFSKFIFQNIKEPYLYNLVYSSFTEFFKKNIFKYTNYKNEQIHFTGSVAFYYGNILRKVASDMEVNVRHIVEGPIAGLALYHQKESNK